MTKLDNDARLYTLKESNGKYYLYNDSCYSCAFSTLKEAVEVIIIDDRKVDLISPNIYKDYIELYNHLKSKLQKWEFESDGLSGMLLVDKNGWLRDRGECKWLTLPNNIKELLTHITKLIIEAYNNNYTDIDTVIMTLNQSYGINLGDNSSIQLVDLSRDEISDHNIILRRCR